MPDRSSRKSILRFPLGRRVVVKDHSMWPALHPGDRLRVDPFAIGQTLPPVGQVVVLRDPQYDRRWLVKRVGAVGPGRFWLFRDRLEPLSSASDTPVPEGATEVVELRNGEVFVLSDNPVGAWDSRRFGAVASSLLVGRVTFRTAPTERAGPL
jgi:signal peptidase I